MGRGCRMLLAVLLLTAIFVCPPYAAAAPDITVQTEAGFEGKVKYGKGAPVVITLSNSGSDFTGDLIVEFMENYNLGGGRAIPVTLAAGETKTIQFAIPGLGEGNMGGQQMQMIFLYEGGWEDGEPIDFKGSDTLTPLFMDPATRFIGVLSSNADSFISLRTGLASQGAATELFQLNRLRDFQFPTDPAALESLDYLIADEAAYRELPAEAQNAVLQWIKEGGTVVFGAGSAAAGTAANLTDYLPLTIAAAKELDIQGFDEPVPGYKAVLNEGAMVLSENREQPVAASRELGSGQVIGIAFSIGDPRITSDSGYATYMQSLLSTGQSQKTVLPPEQLIQDRLVYDIGSVNELFESFAVSLPLAIILVALYILLAVPVLYAVLKWKDRREYAWLIIPLLALLASVLLFAAGAKDRLGNPQIQQTGLFKASGEGSLDGYFVNSLLSNRDGDYRFEAPGGTELASSLTGLFADRNLHQAAIVEQNAEETALIIRNMRYWSVSSIVGHTFLEQAGKFETNLTVKDGQLTGSIRNGFSFAVEDITIWSGTRMMEIGSLGPGEEQAVSKAVQSNVLAPASPAAQYYGFQPVAEPEDILPARKQAALSVAYDHVTADGDRSVYLIGFTREAIAPVELQGQRADVSAVNLLLQPIAPGHIMAGDVELDSPFFDTAVTSQEPGGYAEQISEMPPVYFMQDGIYTLTYSMTDLELAARLSLEELNFSGISRGMRMAILNQRSGEYKTLSPEQERLTENAGQYMSADGQIILEFEVRQSAAADPEITLPQLSVRGVIAE
ncbi:hypothetical protein [Planococcus lenghuensis]|uniref:Uncharacterized protein n=1 Tax=Planococcus lenghuensis TaxID=2213202 RepID=A0A1Q2L078_9BACL|nr:hypothetical protein [Planococcus lenghuensis]AQQ53860.1 hypothetical protein B0X71_12680 [Planococcus lenghuensis]